MKLYYTIGEVARIFDLSIDTLRYYDKLDILKPFEIRENGYRFYFIGQFEILSTIKLLKGLDFTLDEIRALTHQEDLEEVKQTLEKERTSIRKKIRHLLMLEEKVKMICESIGQINSSKGISLCTRPKMWALLIESIFDSKDRDLPEKIEKNLALTDKSWISFSNIISVISPENMKNSQYHSYLYNGLVSTRPCNTESKELVFFQEELCAFKCITVNHDKYYEIDKDYDDICQWIMANGYEICGNTLEINIYNQFLQKDVLRNHLQLWVPVRKGDCHCNV